MEKTTTPPNYSLNEPELYLNRELSHLSFNLRVLAQAVDENHPLLERLRFLAIFSSNMDEFFEIRIASLKKQVDYGRETPGQDGIPPQQILKQLYSGARNAINEQYRILNEILLPALQKQNIEFHLSKNWNVAISHWAKSFFRNEIMPVISPLGLDPAHPFPRLVNKSLNFIISLEGKDAFGRESGMAIVPVPRSLPRLIKIPEELAPGPGDHFIYLSSIILAFADDLFPGMTVKSCHQFRVTRNADLEMNEAEIEDIAHALQGELFARHFGSAVRLEVQDGCPEPLIAFLLNQFNLTSEELFMVNGQVNLTRLFQLMNMVQRSDLVFPEFSPGIPGSIKKGHTQLFDEISQRDYLLHHPYQSFAPVVDLVRTAARDPNVLAIKQTLYRTGSSSPLVDALVEAARNGKEVTVVIELRARFDEEENLHFAARLQEAGAVVAYGIIGYKTHAKLLMVVRREGKKLRRYVHLGTGNYHAGNARIYTDYSLLSVDPELGNDVHKVFQQLTGMGKAIRPRQLLHAPFTLKKKIIEFIDNEKNNALAGKPARIIMKMNAITEVKIIKALYQASQAGVKIDLIVRGMCSLRPSVQGVSENIHVRSVIGRFLEHSRVYYFENGENDAEIYLSSADLRERNIAHRVEVAFPVHSKKHATRIKKELDTYLSDNCMAWVLNNDGTYRQLKPRSGANRRDAQAILMAKEAVEMDIRQPQLSQDVIDSNAELTDE